MNRHATVNGALLSADRNGKQNEYSSPITIHDNNWHYVYIKRKMFEALIVIDNSLSSNFSGYSNDVSVFDSGGFLINLK